MTHKKTNHQKTTRSVKPAKHKPESLRSNIVHPWIPVKKKSKQAQSVHLSDSMEQFLVNKTSAVKSILKKLLNNPFMFGFIFWATVLVVLYFSI